MTVYNTSQERDEAINEMFEASPVYDKSKAMWQAEHRAAAAAGSEHLRGPSPIVQTTKHHTLGGTQNGYTNPTDYRTVHTTRGLRPTR